MNRITPGLALFALLGCTLFAHPAGAQERRPLSFEVRVPPGAVLDFGGFQLQVQTDRHRFFSPPVAVGKEYAYEVKVTHGGKEAVHVISLRHGSENVFDLSGPGTTVKPAGSNSKPARKPGPRRPGFVTFLEDGRLWVFRAGSKDLAAFEKDGELEKHVTRIHAGPRGMTIKGPDNETVVDFMTKRDGFETIVEDGRLWVFRAGSKDLAAFKKDSELAKHVTRIHAGPLGMTLKAPDAETLDAYLKAVAD
jgi:hypothetical protein